MSDLIAQVRPDRILLADDNPDNRKLSLRQLSKLGFSADAAADGREVLTALGTVPYQIILLDCEMPNLNGYDTVREIRLRETSPKHTIVIAMTASSAPADREKCMGAGMDDFISKPVKMTELKEVLDRWLPVRHSPAQPPTP